METGETLLYIRCHFHHEIMFLQSARPALFHLAIVKNENEGNAHDIIFCSQHRACFNVKFTDTDFSF